MSRKHILADEGADFLKSPYEALYFRCGEKRFYFKNGVYLVFTIKSCTIQYEEVIAELNTSCDNLTLWHELYADRLVMCVKHTYSEVLQDAVHTVSEEF
jgi:hypothetical protein